MHATHVVFYLSTGAWLRSQGTPSWAWPHPGRERRVGNYCNVRFVPAAENLQPNQIAEFKCEGVAH